VAPMYREGTYLLKLVHQILSNRWLYVKKILQGGSIIKVAGMSDGYTGGDVLKTSDFNERLL
jgi:hypothetical protein